MISLTPELCRAARGLLALGQRELAQMSNVAHKTIADFELGTRRPYGRTLKEIIAALEANGVVFIAPQDGVHSTGIALRWGSSGLAKAKQQDDKSPVGVPDVSASAAWDDDFEDFATGQPVAPYIIPLTDADHASLRNAFAACPEDWNKLSDRAKAVLGRELGLSDTPSQITNQTA